MSTEKEIVNKVASSGLVTFDLEDYYQPGERILIDIKDWLYQELILKENEFREKLKQHDWVQYQNKFVAVTCTVDSIVPTWAFMLLATALQPYAKMFFMGSLERLEERLFEESLSRIHWNDFKDRKVVVKGCSKVIVPTSIYVVVVSHLKPLVSSLMFGEPCSTVPIYKAPKSPPHLIK